jgi:acyl carrier protein
MTETEERLAICFKSVFSEVSLPEISKADPNSVEDWDSVATVTLLALIEEEFGIDLTIDDLKSDYSFKGILNYISTKQCSAG